MHTPVKTTLTIKLANVSITPQSFLRFLYSPSLPAVSRPPHNHQSAFCDYRLAHSFLQFYINKIIPRVLCFCLASFTKYIILDSFTLLCASILYSSLLPSISLCGCASFFIQSPTDGHWGCLQLLAITNKPAIWAFTYRSLYGYMISVEKILRDRMAQPNSRHIFTLLWN